MTFQIINNDNLAICRRSRQLNPQRQIWVTVAKLLGSHESPDIGACYLARHGEAGAPREP